MSKNKWLRVRLTEEEDALLEQHSIFHGISRSELIRKIINQLPKDPFADQQKLDFNVKISSKQVLRISDSLNNKYLLTFDYRPQFNLWRIPLHKIGRFNGLTLITTLDLVKRPEEPSFVIELNYFVPSSSKNSDNPEETDNILWQVVMQLIEEKQWKKIYGSLNMEMVLREPEHLSWLKSKGFKIESLASQDFFYFTLTLT